MKKALVLGGSGFIGSHVADVLTSKGMDVTIFDISPSKYIKKNQKMILGSITERNQINEVVRGQDYVLNFAGIADLDESKNDPLLATQVNVIGNLNVLEALKNANVQRYIFASTYYVYSNSGSIYRVTKQSCELYIEEYSRLYQVPYTILRFGSLYGTRANEKNGVYNFLKSALLEKKITRIGTGDEIREYIHVIDAALATYETMIKDKYKNGHLILAGNQQTKVRDFLAMINEIMGNSITIEYKETNIDNTDHYKITPYSFKPNIAMRYLMDGYHDLGQGVLEMLDELNEQFRK